MGGLRCVRTGMVSRVMSVFLSLVLVLDCVPTASIAYALDEWQSDEIPMSMSDEFGEGTDNAPKDVGDVGSGDPVETPPGTSSRDAAGAVEVEEVKEPEPEPVPERVRFVFSPNVSEGDARPVTGSMDDFEFVMDGEEHALPSSLYAREGFEFVGWSLTRDGRDVADDPATDKDESFKTLSIPDGLSMVDLGYDEIVEEHGKDADGNDIVISSKSVPRNLEYAKSGDKIVLYAQWREVVDKDSVPDSVEPANAPETESVENLSETVAGEGSEDSQKPVDGAGENAAPVVSEGSMLGVDGDDDVSEPESSDMSAHVALTDDGLSAVTVEGASEDVTKISDTIEKDGGVSRDMAMSMAKRLSAPLRISVPEEEDDVPRQLDGSFIENISVSWVTEDTVDDGNDSRLYLKPSDDSMFSARAVVDYALSGEHDYAAGDVTITVPASVFYYRDGAEAQTWQYPFPEEPSKSGDFMWSRVGDTIVFTNTHRLQAATKGYIEFDMTRLVPHRLVDMAPTEPFWARIEVATHLGNVIGLSSGEIDAVVDTEEKVTAAHKIAGEIKIVPENQIPADARVAGETDYVVVPWGVSGYVEGNTEFTLSMHDQLADDYDGTIISPVVSGDSYSEDEAFRGYASGGTAGSAGITLGLYTVKVAYPLSQFEPGETYTFENDVTYVLEEVDEAVGDDPKLVTTQAAHGSVSWSWRYPKFEDPTGHFMVQKYGNDGATGSIPWESHYAYNRASTCPDNDLWNESSNYVGVYPSALNRLRDGDSVELSYTVDSTGFLLPWTRDGDARLLESYGKRDVTMVTTDHDDTDSAGVWFEDLDLELGRDYEYKAVEFPVAPRIWKAEAINLNPDGSFSSVHAGDGSVSYASDSRTELLPDVLLEANVGGVWRRIATASWQSGNLSLTPYDGSVVVGMRVLLPSGTSQIRTSVTTNVAGVEYHVRPVIELKPSDEVSAVVERLSTESAMPHGDVYNTTYMVAYDDGGNSLCDIHKDTYDELGGYSVDIAVVPSKTFNQVKVDLESREVRVHYDVDVEERSYIPTETLYEDAVSDGYIVPDTSGVFYDLLPLGMSPVVSSVALRSGDSVRDVRVEQNWRGTGRAMLIVKADLSPVLSTWDDDGVSRMMDKLELGFDAVYSFESIVDFGDDTHNVVAYESLAREPLGTIEGKGAEPDDPRSRNNDRTSQAFVSDAEVDAMTGLDAEHSGNRFVYAGVTGTISMPSAARTSLSKDVQVNNDGRWSYGTYDDERTVWEGGFYSYRIRMMSDRNTISRNLVIFDSLENFYASAGNDEADIDAPRWRGEFLGVDTLQLRMMGCDPVVYYSTVDELQLADEHDKNKANDVNTNLSDRNIWVRADEYDGDLGDVHAIAIDCSKRLDGGDFELAPLSSVVAFVRMHAPYGEPVREYVAQDAHAYNNVYLKCTSIDSQTLVENSNNFVRHDYTKIGIKEFEVVAKKIWSDDYDRDGVRPDSVMFQLLANDEEVGDPVEVSSPDWSVTFGNIPYTDENGEHIHYSVRELPVAGYRSSVSVDDNEQTITNTYSPETVRLRGTKTWTGDSSAIPATITVGLMADGILTATKVVTPSVDGTWSYDFGEMLRYRNHGVPIVYTVVELKSPAAWVPSVSGFDIENTYHPFGDLKISKHVVGATGEYRSRRFNIRVDLTDADGEVITDEFAYETTDGRAGTFTSGSFISLAGDESATILEVPENVRYSVSEDTPVGYTLSANGASGKIVANSSNTCELLNKYEANGFVNLRATKTLSGRDLKRYQFRFEVLDQDGSLLRTAANKSDGSVVFGAIRYTQSDVGEHEYTIREIVRDMAGYTFDERAYKAIVTVTDNGNGTLNVDARYEDADGESVDVPLFENEYHAKGSVSFKAWKRLEGRALEDGEFEFELLDEDGNRVGDVVSNNGTGEVIFDEIEFDETDVGKTYKYVAREVAGTDTTVNYSNESYGYIITVVDNGDGSLSFAQDVASVNEGLNPYTFAEAYAADDWIDSDLAHMWVANDGAGSVGLFTRHDGYSLGSGNMSEEMANILSGALQRSMEAGSDLSVRTNAGIVEVTFTDSGWQKFVDALSESGIEDVAGFVGNGRVVEFFDIDDWNSGASFYGLSNRMDEVYAIGEASKTYSVGDVKDFMPVFTNTLKPGSLRIEKHVGDVTSSDVDDQFRFKVKLTGDDVAGIDTLGYLHETIAAPTGAVVADEWWDFLCDAWQGFCGLFEVRNAYAANDDLVTGTYRGVPWRVTYDYELVIGDGSDNQRFSLDGESIYSAGWLQSSVSPLVKSVRFDGTVSAPGTTARELFTYLPAEVIDLTGLDTSESTSLYDLCRRCRSLREVRGLDTLDTHNVTNFSYMFDGCSSLKSLDIHTFDVSSGTNFTNMIRGLSSCDYLDVSGWHFDSVTSKIYFLEGFSNFKTVKASDWYVPSSSFVEIRPLFGEISSDNDGYDLDVSGWTFGSVNSMNNMFSRANVKSITGLDTWDTTGLQNTQRMFVDTKNLSYLDLSGFDMSRVGTMNSMFSYSGLKHLIIDGWDLASIGDYDYAFDNLVNLQKLSARNVHVGTHANKLFQGYSSSNCLGLNAPYTIVDVTGMDLSGVSDASYLFADQICVDEIIGTETMNLSTVTNAFDMFYNCSSVKTLNLAGVDTSNITNMGSMFQKMSSLESLDLTGFDTSNVSNFSYMFYEDSALTELDVSSFDVSPSAYKNSMFYDCSSLEVIYSADDADWMYADVFSNNPALVGGEGTSYQGLTSIAWYARADGLERTGYSHPNNLTNGGLFTAGVYSISFDANGGSGNMPVEHRLGGNEFQIPESKFRRFGYVQSGWVDQDGNEYALDGAIPAGRFSEGDRVVLKAVWSEEDAEVSLDDGEFYVTLGANEAATFENCLPAGTAYSVYEETLDGWVLVSQSNTSGIIAPTEVSVAEFTNRYDEASTSIAFSGVKMLDGYGADAGAFSFELREGTRLIETVANSDGGGVAFSPIVYGEGDVGTHTYLITEVSGGDGTIVYDDHVETVVVEVSKNGRNLSAVPTYDADGIVFSNETVPGAIEITKLTDGGGNPNQEFEFEVELKGVLGAVGAGAVDFDLLGWLWDGIGSLFAPRSAYAVTDGWNAIGSCEWRVADNVLVIRPADGVPEGMLFLDSGVYRYPWNADDVKDTFESVRIEGIVHAPRYFNDFLVGCSNLRHVDFNGLDTSGSTQISDVLERCYSLDYVDLSMLDCSGCDRSDSLVNNIVCDTLDISGLTIRNAYQVIYYSDIAKIVGDGVKLVGTCKAFRQMNKPCEFVLTNLDLSECTNLYGLFEYSPGIRRVRMSSSGPSAVTTMQEMFYGCSNLESVDLSGLDTSNVTNMSNLFGQSGSKLVSVDFSTLDTSKVTTMRQMFAGCSALERLDLSNFDMSSVTDCSYMFMQDTSLVEIDLGHVSMPNLVTASSMFNTCLSLEHIYTSNDTDLNSTSGANFSGMFWACNSLVGSEGTTYASVANIDNGANALPGLYAHVDGVGDKPGLFSGTGSWLRFDTNGGSIVSGLGRVPLGNFSKDVTPPRVFLLGHTLSGWNTAEDGSGESFGPNEVIRVSGSDGSKVLYAQWVPDSEAYSYTVVHRQEDASGNGVFSEVGRETMHSVALSDIHVSPHSYWGFESPEEKVVNIAADGSTEVVFDYLRKRVTLTYVLDDGSETTQVVMGGVRITLPEPLAIDGKRFVGWADGESGENGFYAAGQAVAFDEDAKLYARYVDEGMTYPHISNRTIRVRVKAGETVRIPDVPAGTSYEVREVNVPSGWENVSIVGGTGVVGADSTAYVTARNAYSASGEFDIVAHKSLVGGELTEGAFEFELLDGAGNVVMRSSNGAADGSDSVIDELTGEVVPNPNAGTGTISFRDLPVDSPGTYTYTIREVNGGDANVVYDDHAETVTVVVTDGGDGSLSCDVQYDSDGATFVNRVKPPEEMVYEGASGDLEMSKSVADGNTDKEFTFDVSLHDADGNPVTGSFELRKYTGERDMFSRESVWHTENIADDGTKLRDVASSVPETGVVSIPGAESIHLEYDYTGPRGFFYIWNGDVKDIVEGQHYNAEVNTNTAVASMTYSSSNDNKLLHGSVDIEGDCATITYQCYAYPQNNCPPTNGGYNEWTNYGVFVRATGEVEDYVYDADRVTFVDGHATVTLSDGDRKRLVGLPAGATYEIAETQSDGWMPVSKSGDAGVIPDGGVAEASFMNRYFPEGTFSLSGTKVGVGLEVYDGAFSFELRDESGRFVGRATTASDGTFTFEDIPIDADWAGTTRNYVITELVDSRDGIEWDTHAEAVSVAFSDDGLGHLTGDASYDDDGCVFTNVRLVNMPGTGRGGVSMLGIGYCLAAIMVGASVVVVRRRVRKE